MEESTMSAREMRSSLKATMKWVKKNYFSLVLVFCTAILIYVASVTFFQVNENKQTFDNLPNQEGSKEKENQISTSTLNLASISNAIGDLLPGTRKEEEESPPSQKLFDNGHLDNETKNSSGKGRGAWRWNESAVYQLVVGKCRIPQVPLNHSGIVLREKNEPTFNLTAATCEKEFIFSALVPSKHVVELTDNSMIKSDSCCLSQISRPFGFLPPYQVGNCTPFHPITHTVSIESMEYVMVQCDAPGSGDSPKPKVYNFHINVPLTGNVKLKSDFWKLRKMQMQESSSKAADTPPSVLMLVIDSTSRSEIYRSLPRTLEYMMEDLEFTEFKGHHAIGEPTLTNLVGLLMGLRNEDFWIPYKLSRRNWWDSAPFIWQLFSQLNYVTGYFEDRADIGTFNYGKQRGFVHQPTDIYNYPFLVAYGDKHKLDFQNSCFGKRNGLEMILDHQVDIVKKLGADVPYLLISWPCYPQHDFSHSSLLPQDATYLSFLKQLQQNPSFENTLIIVTSDHGYHGPYPYHNSRAGLLERRIMPLFIRLPQQLRGENGQEKEESIMENLRWNSEGITSHLDVYRTILHVAEMTSKKLGSGEVPAIRKYGLSLLEKIPHERTCKEAGIPQTMCACNLQLHTPTPRFNNLNSKATESDVFKLDDKQYSFPFL